MVVLLVVAAFLLAVPAFPGDLPARLGAKPHERVWLVTTATGANENGGSG